MKGRWKLQDGARVLTSQGGTAHAVIIRNHDGYSWFSGLDSGWCRTIAECRRNIEAAQERRDRP
jgi:hypothetical protein